MSGTGVATKDVPPPTHSTLHVRLKHATAPLHRQTEIAFDLKRQIATIESYRAVIANLRIIHGAVAAALAPMDYLGCRNALNRVQWLDQDMLSLGVSAAQKTTSTLDLKSISEGVGCLYVIEGSMLGGQQIFKGVQKTLGLDQASGGRFFFGFGDETSAKWAAFLLRLNAAPSDIFESAERGARKTFSLFEKCLIPEIERR